LRNKKSHRVRRRDFQASPAAAFDHITRREISWIGARTRPGRVISDFAIHGIFCR